MSYPFLILDSYAGLSADTDVTHLIDYYSPESKLILVLQGPPCGVQRMMTERLQINQVFTLTMV